MAILPQEFDSLIDQIIKDQEGGYVLSKDPDGGDGGWTFAGLTAKTISSFHDMCDYTYDDIARIITNTASAEYADLKEAVWNEYIHNFVPIWFDKLPEQLEGPYLSACINEGEHPPELILQRAVNAAMRGQIGWTPIAEDGLVGPSTLYTMGTIFGGDQGSQKIVPLEVTKSFINNCFLKMWMKSYIAICVSKPSKLQYLEGWHNRVEYWRL